MEKVIGFIGGGNMGSAIIGGIMAAGLVKSDAIWVSDRNESGLNAIAKKFHIHTTSDNTMAAKEADILFLSVKPNIYSFVIEEIAEVIKPSAVIVSIAAGQTLNSVEEMFGKEIRLVRAMPNTPALVGEAMSALCSNKNVTADELEEVKEIFASFGKCEVVEEKLMEAVIGVSGSSPAYVFMFIEALSDAAVLGGMKRDQAYQFAAQSVMGAAKMVLETGLHPGVLKDMVCSPAGTTIAAVASLEKSGFRSAVIEAATACMDKAAEMNHK